MRKEKEYMSNIYDITTNVNDGLKAKFMDEEGDEFKVDFHNDNCVTINVSDYTYMVIDSSTLYELAELVEDAEQKYYEEFKKQKL